MLHGFANVKTTSLCLEDINVDAFRRFFYWLNTGELDCTDDDNDTPASTSISTLKLWPNAVNVCIFASNYEIRRFVVDFNSSMYEFEGFEESKAKDYEKEFLFDVMKAVRDKVLGVRRFGGVVDELVELEGHLRETRGVFCRRYHVHGESRDG